MAVLVLTGTSCVSTIKFKDTQRETISPEALEYYRRHKAVRLPALGITETIASVIAMYDSHQHKPEVEQYQAEHGIKVDRTTIASVPVAVIYPPDPAPDVPVLGLYIHGGGFLAGEAVDYFVMHMARLLGIPIISVDYTLSPKAKYPIAVDQSFRVYEELMDTRGGKKVVVFGVSAGGNLVLTTLLKASAKGISLPDAAVLCTPWTDLTGSGDAYISNDGRDIIAWKNSIEKTVPVYIEDKEKLTSPFVSPVYAVYPDNFPPCIITTGTRDLLLSDAVRLQGVFNNAGITSRLIVAEGMWHGFNTAPGIPEGDMCNREIAEFLRLFVFDN